MHFVTHGQQAVQFCSDLDRLIPDFDSRATKAYFRHVQRAHKNILAVQALTAEFRTQLKLSRRYSGSKLQMMDEFGVKLAELSSEPLYLGTWSAKEVHAKRLRRPPSDAELVSVAESKKPKKRERSKAKQSPEEEEFNEDDSD
jgi:hypothetical protein